MADAKTRRLRAIPPPPPDDAAAVNHAIAVCRANGLDPRPARDNAAADAELARRKAWAKRWRALAKHQRQVLTLCGQAEDAHVEEREDQLATIALLRRDKERALDCIRAADRVRRALAKPVPADPETVLAAQELERALAAYDGAPP